MASSVSGFLLLFTLLSLLVGLMSQYFKAYLEFDNKLPIIKPIYEKHADSISICATFCGFGCKCFNFNLQTGMCRTYNSCNALYMTVNETGWRLYVDPPLNTKDTADAKVFQHRCLYANYIHLEETVSKNHYCLIQTPTNWTNAKEKCLSFGSHLLEINTEAEQNWLNGRVSGSAWWTGGVKNKNGVDWIWENSSSGMVFTNWGPSQPNNGGEECMLMWSYTGQWSDYVCNYKFSLICEMKYML